MRTIQSSFGISPKSSIDERQAVLATAVVTSLITYFTTRQLVQMGSDEDSDELIGTTNHLIAAIEDHETRITRIEERQKQSDKVVNKLKDSLVLGLKKKDKKYNEISRLKSKEETKPTLDYNRNLENELLYKSSNQNYHFLHL